MFAAVVLSIVRGNLGYGFILAVACFRALQVHHLGMYHESLTDCCVLYYNRLPSEVDADVAVVLEPVIGSGEPRCSIDGRL